MPQMVWTTRPDGFHDYYNDRWYEFTGVPYGSTDGETLERAAASVGEQILELRESGAGTPIEESP